MAWQKISKENHPLLRAALPADPRIEIKPMFGGLAAFVNGHSFTGLWADTAIVRLAPADRATVLKMKGAVPFDPMQSGRPRPDQVLLPPDVLHDDKTLKSWVAKAFAHTATLPAKDAKKSPKRKG